MSQTEIADFRTDCTRKFNSAHDLNVMKEVLDNIISNPMDPRFVRLRLSNPRIKEGLNDGAISLLKDVGF